MQTFVAPDYVEVLSYILKRLYLVNIYSGDVLVSDVSLGDFVCSFKPNFKMIWACDC